MACATLFRLIVSQSCPRAFWAGPKVLQQSCSVCSSGNISCGSQCGRFLPALHLYCPICLEMMFVIANFSCMLCDEGDCDHDVNYSDNNDDDDYVIRMMMMIMIVKILMAMTMVRTRVNFCVVWFHLSVFRIFKTLFKSEACCCSGLNLKTV